MPVSMCIILFDCDQILHDFKFEFLRIVCSHEHFIPLSLPLMRKGMVKNFKGQYDCHCVWLFVCLFTYCPHPVLSETKPEMSCW